MSKKYLNLFVELKSMRMSLYFLCMIIPLLSPLIKADIFTKVDTIFYGNVTAKEGDVIQCEITKMNTEETNNEYHLLTKACNEECYVYQTVTEKCFSFKVKGTKNAFIELTHTSEPESSYRLEILLEAPPEPSSVIREARSGKVTFLNKLSERGVINDREYSGFWIRWYDELLEVGRESETIPFLHHTFSRKLQINFVGFYTWRAKGAWIINKNPKCPGKNETEVKANIRAESDCLFLK